MTENYALKGGGILAWARARIDLKYLTYNMRRLAQAVELAQKKGRTFLLCPFVAHVNLLRNCKGVINFNSNVSDGTSDFGVYQK